VADALTASDATAVAVIVAAASAAGGAGAAVDFVVAAVGVLFSLLPGRSVRRRLLLAASADASPLAVRGGLVPTGALPDRLRAINTLGRGSGPGDIGRAATGADAAADAEGGGVARSGGGGVDRRGSVDGGCASCSGGGCATVAGGSGACFTSADPCGTGDGANGDGVGAAVTFGSRTSPAVAAPLRRVAGAAVGSRKSPVVAAPVRGTVGLGGGGGGGSRKDAADGGPLSPASPPSSSLQRVMVLPPVLLLTSGWPTTAARGPPPQTVGGQKRPRHARPPPLAVPPGMGRLLPSAGVASSPEAGRGPAVGEREGGSLSDSMAGSLADGGVMGDDGGSYTPALGVASAAALMVRAGTRVAAAAVDMSARGQQRRGRPTKVVTNVSRAAAASGEDEQRARSPASRRGQAAVVPLQHPHGTSPDVSRGARCKSVNARAGRRAASLYPQARPQDRRTKSCRPPLATLSTHARSTPPPTPQRMPRGEAAARSGKRTTSVRPCACACWLPRPVQIVPRRRR